MIDLAKDTRMDWWTYLKYLITKVVYTPLYLWENDWVGQLKVITVTAFVFAFIGTGFESWFSTYVFGDYQFLNYFAIALSVEAAFGAWKHWELHDFNCKKLLFRVTLNAAMCLLTMIIFNGILGVSEDGGDFSRQYIEWFYKIMILAYFALSSFNSMFIISGGKFPPLFWMKRMESYNKTGNASTLFGEVRKEDLDESEDNKEE